MREAKGEKKSFLQRITDYASRLFPISYFPIHHMNEAVCLL
jgi:hypothetical protein